MKVFFTFIDFSEATSGPCRPELDTKRSESACLALSPTIKKLEAAHLKFFAF
ncbi:hypothetical protein QNH23_17655 [Siminovitchia fortis]|uniref:hypothetical protein n=1 Tax=Siminovitchia fortis TaxID=254758 RepID=UPI0013E2E334|nr:hypothetical protein [Siminovitchia fortis]WHY81669.1 hypothetical protein QNH23_17655 [Siminovitchia fortis]